MASRPRLSDHSDDVSCEQGDCSPPPPPAPVPPSPLPPPSSSPGSHTFVTALIITGSALAVLVLCLFLFLFVRRRRRRREALLEAALAPAAPDGVGVLDRLADQEAEGEEIVHHAWHIRTVGLDEAAIESIPLTRYRAGASADCAVCLGEFVDGELLRLLPRCAHAFHVRCIDTWLRAHVNCPFCRSHVLDSGPAAQQSDSPEGSDAVDAGQAASSNTTTEHEQPGQQRVVRLQIDQHDGRSPEQPHRHPGPRGQNFRRVASMDLSLADIVSIS
jgi:hypothetical protein